MSLSSVSFSLLQFIITDLIYPFLSLGSFLLRCGLIVWVASKILAFCVHEYRKYTDPWYYVSPLGGLSSLAPIVSHIEEKKAFEERKSQDMKAKSSKILIPMIHHNDCRKSESAGSVIFDLMENEIFLEMLRKFLLSNDSKEPIWQAIKKQTV